jgi:hypothetical protein
MSNKETQYKYGSQYLKAKYESACNDYVKLFCHKQGLEFDGWAGDTVGSIAFCSDMSFNLSDIVFDINTNQPKGLIIQWYNDSLESSEANTSGIMNYWTYSKIYGNGTK